MASKPSHSQDNKYTCHPKSLLMPFIISVLPCLNLSPPFLIPASKQLLKYSIT